MTELSIGPYRTVRKIGEGGMGVVFEAIHETIEHRVAIKLLHPEFAHSAEVAVRFINEARAVNRVDHPGLVQIFDYGHLADGTAYIVMELLTGETLASRLRRLKHHLAVNDTLRLGLFITEALVAAHKKGVIHRDLKPENVMIVPDLHTVGGQRTKLLDFGIAKLKEGVPGQIKTSVSAVLGTPTYMSPEQCQGAGQVDEQTDVYSLGVMFYEMLSGRTPFAGAGSGEIMAKHLYEPPPLLTAIAPEVPLALAALVHKMLGKDKHLRPSMGQVLVELEALTSQSPQPSPERVKAGPNDTTVPLAAMKRIELRSTLGGASGQARPMGSARRRLGLSIAAAAVAVAALLGGYKVHTRTEPAFYARAVPREPGIARKLAPDIVHQSADSGQLQMGLRLPGYSEQKLSFHKDGDETQAIILEKLPAARPSSIDHAPAPARQGQSDRLVPGNPQPIKEKLGPEPAGARLVNRRKPSRANDYEF